MLPNFEASIEFAKQQDKQDSLAHFKDLFHFPQHNNQPAIYFCGNSLGLQPKSVAAAIETELNTWKELAVGGYFKGPINLIA